MENKEQSKESNKKKKALVTTLMVALVVLIVILALSFNQEDKLAPGDQGIPRVLVSRQINGQLSFILAKQPPIYLK